MLTCTPPKSGTTSWIRGLAVLKDRIKGIYRRPEDYNPRELFYRQAKSSFNPYNLQTRITGADWTKITAVRNPLERLYSAWKDKSRTFRFENGEVNWEKAIAETPWAWGTEHMTEHEKMKILKEALKSHDQEFDSKRIGIAQFEDRDSTLLGPLRALENEASNTAIFRIIKQPSLLYITAPKKRPFKMYQCASS